MLQTIRNAVAFHGKFKSFIITGAMLAGLGLPTAALADHHDRRGFHVDVEIPLPRIFVPAPFVPVPVCPVPICPAPACPAPVITTTDRVWVPAVYQTVTEKVWVPDVTTPQIQRVEVPATYGYRDIVRVGIFGPRIRHERYLISPAYCEDRQVAVVVTPGHFEYQTQQQLVAEGHWETQVLEVRAN